MFECFKAFFSFLKKPKLSDSYEELPIVQIIPPQYESLECSEPFLAGCIDIRDDKNLTELRLHDCTSITVFDCPKITKIPDMCKFNWLETLNIQHCDISACRTYLPESLRVLNLSYCGIQEFIPQNMPTQLAELDLSFNKLRKIPECISVLNNTQINLRNNDFWFTMYSDLNPAMIGTGVANELALAYKLNLISTSKVKYAINILRDKTLNAEAALLSRLTLIELEVRRKDGNSTSTNKQNVHLTSVQESMKRSVEFVLAYKYMNIPTEKLIQMTITDMNCSDILSEQIRERCSDATIHSVYKASYSDVFIRVLSIIYDSRHKDTLLNIMRAELEDGMNTCLTGQITRMVNALNGFVDGVKITINKTEELTNSIVALRKRYALIYLDQDAYIAEAVPAVWQMLEDMCVPELEHAMWLEYV